jgi:hypothetical protein
VTAARERFESALQEPSDIRDHLPRMRREAQGSVLELGVRSGNSTAALLAGVEDRGGTVWSIDVDADCQYVFAGHPQWRFVLADSRDARTIVAHGLPAELDVLFVDTIHTYAQVRDELEVWGDCVRSGGLILVHDTDSSPEIRDAISQWCRARKVPFEFRGRSNGLGLAYPGRSRLFGAWLACARARRRGVALIARTGIRIATAAKGPARRARRGLARILESRAGRS